MRGNTKNLADIEKLRADFNCFFCYLLCPLTLVL